MHSLGLYRADVRPQNILVREGDAGLHACLADLGIAIEVGHEGSVKISTPRTTMWFRAPELLGGPDPGHRRVLASG